MTGPVVSRPRIDVIVATLNEATTIAAKIADLGALTYPSARMRVVLIDGGSADDTVAIALAAAASFGVHLDVVASPVASKPAQVNAACQLGDAPYVLVTDADSRLPPTILERLVEALEGDPQCALVSPAIRTASPVVFERVFWHYSNRLREVEARIFGSAGLVVGPCYLARRSLMEPLGNDVVSDDAHVSLSVLARGFRVGYVDVPVAELRGPATFGEFVRHKLRKAAAYLREIVRVVERRDRCEVRQRRVVVFRVFLLTTLPWLLSGAGAWALWTRPMASVGAAGLAILAFAARSLARRHPWPALAGGAATVALPWVVAAMLIVTMLSYPFTTLSPSYPKVTLFADPEV